MNKLRLTGLLLTRLLGLWLVCASCVQSGYAQQSGGGNYPAGNGIRVKEVDGSPNVPGTQTLVFPNGSLTRAGQTVTVTIAGGTTINSTNGQVPYRVNSTTFGDSAFASNALNSTYLSATSGAIGAGVTLAVAGGGTNENLRIGTVSSGTLSLFTANTIRWSVSASGHFLAGTDNTYDIGESGVTRPRNVYVAGNIVGSNSSSALTGFLQYISTNIGYIGWAGRSYLQSPSDGVIFLQNTAGTDFSRLQFGGTSASFPSIKRNGAGLDVRLADDSGYADLVSKTITATGGNASLGNTIINSNVALWGNASNVLTIIDTGFAGANVRLNIGGTTSSFPAIKRSSAELQVRLADDSAFAAEQSLYIRYGSGTPEGAVTAPVGAIYSRTDGGAGTSFYVKESGTGNTGWVAK